MTDEVIKESFWLFVYGWGAAALVCLPISYIIERFK
jgi:hypothetical protein